MTQEEQVKKIQDLFKSKNDADFELGAQLMISQGLIKGIPKRFKEVKIVNTEKKVTSTEYYSSSWNIFFGHYLEIFKDQTKDNIPQFVGSTYFYLNITKCLELLLNCFSRFLDKIPKVMLEAVALDRKYILSSETICSKSEINSTIKLLKLLNSFNQKELNKYIKSKSNLTEPILPLDSFLDWMMVRKKSFPKPILYKVQELGENYSSFKVQVTIITST